MVMDNQIWDRNSSMPGVISRCAGDKKTNDHAEPTKHDQRITPTLGQYDMLKSS